MFKIAGEYYDRYIILNKQTNKLFAAIEYKGEYYRSQNMKEFTAYHDVMIEIDKYDGGQYTLNETFNILINL